MQLSGVLSSLLLVASAFASPVRRGAPDDAPGTIGCAYIIRFPQGVDALNAVDAHFRKLNVAYKVRTSMSTKLTNFVSVQLAGSCDDSQITGLSAATEFFTVRQTQQIKPVRVAASETQKNPELIHSLSGVNDARKKLKLTGKGVTVAVIDSGVHYLHPALGGGFGPGYKVAKGWDFVGEQYGQNGDFTPKPSPDPLDNCTTGSHGTHVAGIIAADARNITTPGWIPDIPFTGVAPDATIYAYRVFGCPGSGSNDVIIAAIYKAAEDGAQILNLSLGSGPSYSDDPTSIAVEDVSKAGHLVVIAAGNDGRAGPFAVASPSVSKGGLSIAAFDNIEAPAPFLTVDGAEFFYSLGGNNANFDKDQVLDIVVNNLDADAKDIQDDGTQTTVNPEAKGKALLIRWGDLTFGGSVKRCAHAVRSGAVACILYNNGLEDVGIAGAKEIPSMITERTAAQAIIAAIKAGKKPQVIVTGRTKMSKLPTAATVSGFSAPGLDNELFIKPELGGFGGHVLSTDGNGVRYAVNSGTSMACPYVAGVTALVVQARGKLSQSEFRAYLQNNASPKQVYGENFTDSPAYQGAGLVNAYWAAKTKTLVVPSSFSFNDTDNHLTTATFTITNNQKISMNYYLNHRGAATVNPLLPNDDFSQDASTTSVTDKTPATLKFLGGDGYGGEAWSFKLVRVPAGKSVSVSFKITPPKVDPSLYPIYGGYIRIVNDLDDNVINIPYAGVVGSWKKRAVWSRNSPSLAARVFGAQISTGIYSSSLNPLSPNAIINGTSGYAIVLPIPASTSRIGTIDAVYQGTNLTAFKAAGFNGTRATAGLIDLGRGIIGSSYSAPLPRVGFTAAQSIQGVAAYAWNGVGYIDDAKRAVLPPGPYKIEFRALKHFGNPKIEADWDVITSDTVNLVY
ncbi:UNVERIFIED_CONTAM: hypothetical protein HDU68_005163 [Siphonaria sp. JEL0065]|nr:hypothetical protein HDU68_005163 [Siphonaria sp. JEL0065]